MPDGNAGIPNVPPAQNQTKSDGFSLADVKLNGKDAQGREITYVYVTRHDKYAIYLAGDVRVQYADDPSEEANQRARVISSVGKARAEITSLLVGWRQRCVYDCKVALSLELALEGKADEARMMINEAKAALVEERKAAGRFQYIGFTACWCIVLLALFTGNYWLLGMPMTGGDLLMAGLAGLVGAAFSIALAMRKRTVALDTDRWSNAFDGLLRLFIGVVSGGVLLLLLSSGVVPKLMFGGQSTLDWAQITWKGVLVVGFVAGFLERLVPDLLDKATAVPVGAPPGHRS